MESAQRSRAGALCRVHDLAGGLVEYAVVISLQRILILLCPTICFLFTQRSCGVVRPRLCFDQFSFRQQALLPRSTSSQQRLVPEDWVAGVFVHQLHDPGYYLVKILSHDYLIISVMVPAPTVRPPSRIAKRKPFSIATGVISSISSATLSPGITISVPAGNSPRRSRRWCGSRTADGSP